MQIIAICNHQYYEEKIRDTEDKFSIEDYEVFQIIDVYIISAGNKLFVGKENIAF